MKDITSLESITVREALQMAVDYYTLSATAFEDKYPIRPPEKEYEPCWVAWAKKALENVD
jgi:hypothetical protein